MSRIKGSPKTGGRKAGAPNKRSAEAKAAALAVVAKFKGELPAAFIGDGVAYLQTVYCDPTQPAALRIDAAKAAARFERPALVAGLVKDVTENGPIRTEGLVDDRRPGIEKFLVEFGRAMPVIEAHAEPVVEATAEPAKLDDAEAECLLEQASAAD